MPLRVVKLGGSLLDMPQLVARCRSWIAQQAPADNVLVIGGGAMVDAVRRAQRLHGLSDKSAHWLCIRAMAVQAEMMLSLMPEAAGLVAVEDLEAIVAGEADGQGPIAPSSFAGNLPSLSGRGRGRVALSAAESRSSAAPSPPTPLPRGGEGSVSPRGSATPSASSCTRMMILDPWRFLHDEEPRLAREPLPESWDVTSDSIAARLAQFARADELVLLKSALPAEETIAEMSKSGFLDRYFPQAAAGLERVRIVNLRDAAYSELVVARQSHEET